MTTRAYHHGDLRAALMAVGLTLLDEGGVDSLTIRAIARRAGVAHSAPANHFKDRAALLRALAIRILEDLSEEVGTALRLAAPLTREGRIHLVAKAFIDFALRHPNRYRLLWRQGLLGGETPGAEAAASRLYEQVTTALGPGAGTSSTSLKTEVIATWSLVHGYVSLRIEGVLVAGRDEVSGKPRSESIVDVLIRGLDGGGP